MILTKQMLRDKLIFKGPITLNELSKLLGLDDIERSKALILLNDLLDLNQAKLDLNTGLWSSDVKIE